MTVPTHEHEIGIGLRLAVIGAVLLIVAVATGIAVESTDSELIDLDTALAKCDLLIVLVDHDLFKSIPLEERSDKIVYDTRGLWLDQPGGSSSNRLHRAA